MLELFKKVIYVQIKWGWISQPGDCRQCFQSQIRGSLEDYMGCVTFPGCGACAGCDSTASILGPLSVMPSVSLPVPVVIKCSSSSVQYFPTGSGAAAASEAELSRTCLRVPQGRCARSYSTVTTWPAIAEKSRKRKVDNTDEPGQVQRSLEGKLSSQWGTNLELGRGSHDVSQLQEPGPTFGEHQPKDNCSSRPHGYQGTLDWLFLRGHELMSQS